LSDTKNTSKSSTSLSELNSVFLDNMSHELRTPVTVILGYASILYEELNDPELKEMAEIILKSSNRLTDALNLILDQADIETHRLKINFEPKNIAALVRDTVKIFEHEISAKELELNLNIQSDEIFADTDERMFSRIVNNLVQNAVKFTKEGKITVSLRVEGEGEEQTVILEVIDTGIGIPDEYQTLIFEAFRQISEGMNRKYQGVGLGLSVTKKFVELLGGSIEVTSKEGEGAHFTVKLPVKHQ